jgi:cephalosporin hydroxylase
MNWFLNAMLFKLKNIYKAHHKITYKGVSAIKCPFDYVMYQMIIFETKPDIIIEIGTNKGGSTLYLADLLEMNGKGVIHTIDLPANNEDPKLHHNSRIKIFKEGFLKYDTSLLSKYETILIIEDGSHMYADTLAALKKFSPFVSTNSYFIVEDGIINHLGFAKRYNGGPCKAIKEFLNENMCFKIDRSWCDFFGENATFNVNGYLKKTK